MDAGRKWYWGCLYLHTEPHGGSPLAEGGKETHTESRDEAGEEAKNFI